MAIFDWLRTKPPAPSDSRTASKRMGGELCEFSDNIISIPSLDFVGQFARSPNDRFLLAWRDGNDTGTHGGARQSGPGRFLLIENGAVVANGRAERPNDGKVADNGTFIINDWLFYRSALEGVFLAYRKDGSQIVSKRFEANLFNNGLSPDGRLAVCQTCNAPGEDGSILALFDLEAGNEVGRFVPESGWARAYEFPADRRTVRLCYGNGAFAFGLDGAFVDRPAWIASRLADGDVYAIQRLVRDAGENSSSDLVRSLIEGLGRGIERARNDPQMRALAFKLRGSCFDRLDDQAAALADFDAALALNPKIGVKKRAEALRRAGGLIG